MITIAEPKPPTNTAELRQSLTELDRQVTDLWNRIGPEIFFAFPADGGWSPAQNLSHLALSTNIVTVSLRLPRLLPRIVFGLAKAPPRSYEQIRDKYKSVLNRGAGAGPFTPRKGTAPKDPVAERARRIARWTSVVPPLVTEIDRWPDADLDRYRLLHPLIGRLSMREMLSFTLYHLYRHSDIVARRMSG
ncbi:MAG: DinB family protein [Pirellulales bacterium]|nr:DinB family protein [Pirellulales bacterium]